MGMSELYTNQLEERVYSGTEKLTNEYVEEQLKEQQYYKSVEIGLATLTSRIEMGDINSEMYSSLQQAIENERRTIDQQDSNTNPTTNGVTQSFKKVQELGNETTTEQKNTYYIDETESGLKVHETEIGNKQDNTKSL